MGVLILFYSQKVWSEILLEKILILEFGGMGTLDGIGVSEVKVIFHSSNVTWGIKQEKFILENWFQEIFWLSKYPRISNNVDTRATGT